MAMTLSELAGRIDAELRGDGTREVCGCATLDDAGPEHVTFLANQKYSDRLGSTRAGAVILGTTDVGSAPTGLNLVVAKDPYYAFRQAVVELHGFRRHPEPGISELAVVDSSAQVDEGCVIQPFAVVAAGAKVGARTVIYPHCYIGPDSVIGEDCQLFPNVTIYDRCVLGNRVTLHSGCVIGQDGFGYAPHQPPGAELSYHKIPQIGNAIVEDDVEMGACCTVDRATVGSTVIGRGSKLSDLVAIGHGTKVGPYNLLVAQVGLAGSVETGGYVQMGGQVGVAGHLKIGDGAQLAAKSGVMDDIPGGKWGGQPAMPLNLAKRNVLAMMKMADVVKEFRALQKRVNELESRLAKEEAAAE